MAHDFGIRSQHTTANIDARALYDIGPARRPQVQARSDARPSTHTSEEQGSLQPSCVDTISDSTVVAIDFLVAVAHPDRMLVISELNRSAIRGRDNFLQTFGHYDQARRVSEQTKQLQCEALEVQLAKSILLQAVLVRTLCDEVDARLPAELREIVYAELLILEDSQKDDWFNMDQHQHYEEVMVLPCDKEVHLGFENFMPPRYSYSNPVPWSLTQRQLMGEDVHREYVHYWFSNGRFEFLSPLAVPLFLFRNPFAYHLLPAALVRHIQVEIEITSGQASPYNRRDFEALTIIGAIASPRAHRVIDVWMRCGDTTSAPKATKERRRAIALRNFIVRLWNVWRIELHWVRLGDVVIRTFFLPEDEPTRAIWGEVLGLDLDEHGNCILEIVKAISATP